MAATTEGSAPTAQTGTGGDRARVSFQTDPGRYRHWRLAVDAPVATLAMDGQEDGGLRDGYELKLNSYDLGVDIELYDAVQRLRVEHPEGRAGVFTRARGKTRCAGATWPTISRPGPRELAAGRRWPGGWWTRPCRASPGRRPWPRGRPSLLPCPRGRETSPGLSSPPWTRPAPVTRSATDTCPRGSIAAAARPRSRSAGRSRNPRQAWLGSTSRAPGSGRLR